MEPPSTRMPELDASPVAPNDGAGADAFVVSAYESHHAEVFALLVRTIHDRSLAEDLLQETYLRLASEARAGHVPRDVRAWLYRTASQLAINRARRQTSAPGGLRRRGRTADEETLATAADTGALGQDRTAEMERVLEGLTADARLALLLSSQRFAGEEIAAAMGQSSAATRSLLIRARARVRVRRKLFADAAR